jgi:hypothetical protein
MTAQALSVEFGVIRALELGEGDLQSICFAVLCVLYTTAGTVVRGGGGGGRDRRNLLMTECSDKCI